MSYELELDKLRKAFGRERIRMQDRVVWHVDVKCGWMKKANNKANKIIKPLKIVWKPYMETITLESFWGWSDTLFVGPITTSTIGSIHAMFYSYRIKTRESYVLLGWTRSKFVG